MALSYSLRYKKLNLFQKVLLEKEGEIIINHQSFRLKGKGAGDMGVNIFFSDIKDLFIREDHVSFTTYSKEKYVLKNFSPLYDDFLKDFIKHRNEFLADQLFMKIGMLTGEHDGYAEIITPQGEHLNKGKCRLQFYEGSLVIFPQMKEVICVHFNSLKSHEFDEDEYVLKLYLDHGTVIQISKLGSSFQDVEELLSHLLGRFYEKIMGYFHEALPGFDAGSILKVAHKVKDGKSIQLTALKKIHEEMPGKFWEFASLNRAIFEDKISTLRKLVGDDKTYVGLFGEQQLHKKDSSVVPWLLFCFPEQNLIVIAQPGRDGNGELLIFQIILQQGEVKEKLPGKILELEQMVTLLKSDWSPVYRDRKDLQRTKYKTAIKKLSYLRLLRKSFLGKSIATSGNQLEYELKDFFARSQLKGL